MSTLIVIPTLASLAYADAMGTVTSRVSAVYATGAGVAAWCILILTEVVNFIQIVNGDFWSNIVIASCGLGIATGVLLLGFFAHAVHECYQPLRPQRPVLVRPHSHGNPVRAIGVFLKLALIGEIIWASAIIAYNAGQANEELSVVTAAPGMVFFFLCLLAVVPNVLETHHTWVAAVGFWLSFLVSVVGWTVAIYVGRSTQDSSSAEACTDMNAFTCSTQAAVAAGLGLIVLCETCITVCLGLFARDVAASGGAEGRDHDLLEPAGAAPGENGYGSVEGGATG